jgi:hypothetical protein
MSDVTELLDELFRAGVGSRGVTKAADLTLDEAPELLPAARNLSAEQLDEAIAALRAGNAGPDVVRVFQALSEVTRRLSRSAGAGAYGAKDVIVRKGKTLRGRYLQRELAKWRRTLAPGEDDSAEAFLRAKEQLVIKQLDSLSPAERRLAVVLKTVLGTPFDYTKKAARRVTDRRPTLGLLLRYFPTGKVADVADDFARMAQSEAMIGREVERAFRQIDAMLDDFPDQLAYLSDFYDDFDDPANLAVIQGLTVKLLRLYAPDGDLSRLTKADIARLVGPGKNSGQHVYCELVLAQLMVFSRLDEAKTLETFSLPATDLFAKFLEVPGAEGFFQTILSRAPHEHGYVFEQVLNFNLIDALLRKGLNPGERLIIQAKIGGQSAQDALLIVIEAGERIAQTYQAKSFRSLAELARASRGSADLADSVALGEASGEIIQQAWKDLRRVLGSGGRAVDSATGKPVDIDRFDGLLRSKLDLARLMLDGKLFDSAFEDGVHRILHPPPADKTATKLVIGEIIDSTDPKVRNALRQQLQRQHLDPILLPLKTEIASIPAHLAEEVRKLDLAKFEAAYAEPLAKRDWLPRYRELVGHFTEMDRLKALPSPSAADWAAIDGLEITIRDKFLFYFESMYKCPRRTLEIEFDPVNVIADIDVSRGAIRVKD